MSSISEAWSRSMTTCFSWRRANSDRILSSRSNRNGVWSGGFENIASTRMKSEGVVPSLYPNLLYQRTARHPLRRFHRAMEKPISTREVLPRKFGHCDRENLTKSDH